MKSKQKLIGIGLIILLVTPILVNFYQGQQELERMDKKIAKLNQDIERLKQKKDKLNSEIKRVNSKDFIEDIAREKLGLVKQGEMLYITVEE